MAFCSKCGTQLADGSSFCTNCGNPVTASTIQTVVMVKPKIPGRGFGISSMVLGIIGAVYALAAFTATINDEFAEGALAGLLVLSVLSILSLCFAPAAMRRGYKNGISIAGLFLGIVGCALFAFAVFSFLAM